MTDAIDLSGKSILVTGASMGIGATAARVCLESGASVTICARGKNALEQTASQLSAEFGSQVESVAVDVSDAAAVARAFDRAATRFGDLHGVVHAAAVIDAIGSILDVDPEAWRRTVEIDLFGTFLVTREACKRMKMRGGRIVLFSGGGASEAYPNFTAYGCSKVAVVRFAETVAQEMRPFGIEVNALAPGLVATRMLVIARSSGVDLSGAPATVPPEIGARAAAFLVSDAARGITGKFVSAVRDDYVAWPQHLEELQSTDAFTLRRILPRDRGKQWQ